MSATEQLRKMLDERGIEYETFSGTFATKTEWPCMNGLLTATFVEYDDGSVRFEMSRWYSITPEQAIEASLEAGTCRTVAMDCFGNPPYNMSGLNGNSTACGCSECGVPWSTMGVFRGNQLKHNFKACPICGRKVVDE